MRIAEKILNSLTVSLYMAIIMYKKSMEIDNE